MNDKIKKMSAEELEVMDKQSLIERNLLLEEQLEIRIERENRFTENVSALMQVSTLLSESLKCVYEKYKNDIKSDMEMSKHLLGLENKYKSIMLEFTYNNQDAYSENEYNKLLTKLTHQISALGQ